jgi:hypothetical protein
MGKSATLAGSRQSMDTRDRVESSGFDRAALAGPSAKEAESGGVPARLPPQATAGKARIRESHPTHWCPGVRTDVLILTDRAVVQRTFSTSLRVPTLFSAKR